MYQRYDENGNWVGPDKFKEIEEEAWFISKNTSTSYTDVLNITPIERKHLVDIIKESIRREREDWDKAIRESQERNKLK